MLGALALVLIAAVVVIVVVVSGGSSSAGPSTSPTTGSSSTSAGGAVTTAVLRQDGLCSGTCTITGRVQFTHPQWGKVTLVTVQGTSDGKTLALARVAVIDSTGADKWDYKVGPVLTFAPIPDPIDSTGNIFLKYNSGRYDGIAVVGPTSDSLGMTDYSTVPDSSGTGRFYDATVKKVDGKYQIDVENNTCSPNCASGQTTTTTYTWNGYEYVSS